MQKTDTKQKILDAALDLFSVQGYEATSISQIADAVDIRKASLYSHFKSKQEILDALIETVLEEYNRHSVFANADWDDPAFLKTQSDVAPDVILQKILAHLRYILHDPKIKKARMLLTIEQFGNERLKALQTKQNYTDVLRYFTGMIRFFIRSGKMVADAPQLAAAQLCLPINVWINLCDREPNREPEIMELIERYVRRFFDQASSKIS